MFMADVFTKKKRSEVMGKICSAGNKETETALVELFRRHKVKGWRRNARLIGKPDFIFRESRVAVFVDGCFWHGCRRHFRMPASNRDYWKQKINRNINRDKLVGRLLRGKGWRVLRIWAHDLKPSGGKCISRIRELVANGTSEKPPLSGKRRVR